MSSGFLETFLGTRTHTAACPCGASVMTDDAVLAQKFVELHAAHNVPLAFSETRRVKLRCPKCEEEILAVVRPPREPK